MFCALPVSFVLTEGYVAVTTCVAEAREWNISLAPVAFHLGFFQLSSCHKHIFSAGLHSFSGFQKTSG